MRATPLRNYHRLGLAVALLCAALLPLTLLTQQPFHHDEALYATWALQIASGQNPGLVGLPVDKPPLFIYTAAGAMWLLGPTETAARLPSLIATLVSVGLTFRLGQRLYGRGVGLLAAWLMALSPFTLMLAPTALTDPLLVALVLAGCLAASHRQAIWAGLWLGLAIATKQQGLLFGPLVLGVLLISPPRPPTGGRDRQPEQPSQPPAGGREQPNSPLREEAGQPEQPPQPPTGGREQPNSPLWGVRGGLQLAFSFLLTALLTVLPTLLWDWNRAQTPGVWQLGLINYGGLSAATGDLAERGRSFLNLLTYATASPLLNGLFLVLLPWRLLASIGGLWRVPPRPPGGGREQPNSPLWGARGADSVTHSMPLPHRGARGATPDPQTGYLADILLTLFIVAFLFGHVLLSFQVWDRYLLGLIPLLALLLARLLLWPLAFFNHRWPAYQRPIGWAWAVGLAILLLATLLPGVRDAANARYPLGSHSAALSGIEQTVAYLRGQVGANHTLYHHWLGTHWRFYLWDYPYDLQYWATPEELAAVAQPGHLIAFPAWRSETEARLALAQVNLSLHEVNRAYHPAGAPSIILYRIEASLENN